MSDYNVQFQYPFLWGLLLLPLLLAVPVFRARRRGGRVNLLSPLLRCAAIALAVLLLSGISVKTTGAEKELVVLLDASDSMKPRQAEAEEAARTLLTQAQGYAEARLLFFGMNASADASAVDPGATGLENALQAAADSVAPGRKGHIIALTDGLETAGDAWTKASALGDGGGFRLDAVYFDTAPASPEIEISAVEVPANIALGQSCDIRVECRTNEKITGTLRLVSGNTVAVQKKITAYPGSNVYPLRLSPVSSGTLTYQAEIVPDADTVKENNKRAVCLQVLSGDKILLVEGKNGAGQALTALLTQGGLTVDTVYASMLPTSVQKLCEYGLIALLDVDAQYMNIPQHNLLSDYAAKYGRSVLFAGGENTFSFGHIKGTALEKMLPVRLDAGSRDEGEAIALVLLVDNSASMGETRTRMKDSNDSAMNQAKKGAIRCLDALRPSDRLAILCFSESVEEIYPMASAEEREQMLTAISTMGTLDGTNFSAGLEAALNAFAGYEDFGSKQVILISDGNPSDENYEEWALEMRRRGITLSTIGVGSAVNKEVMQRLADLGGGRFSFTTMSDDLESLMAASAELLQSDAVGYPPLTLSWEGEGDVPALTGYNRLSAKSGAEVIAAEAGGDPICAQWAFGKGTVGALAFDLSGRWSGPWLAEEKGKRILLNLFRSLLPENAGETGIELGLEDTGAEKLLWVHSPVPASRMTVRLQGAQETEAVDMVQVKMGRFEAYLPLEGPGPFEMLLTPYGEDGRALDSIPAVAASAWPLEYEAFPQASGEALLQSATEALGGRLWHGGMTITEDMLDHTAVTLDPAPLLCAAIAVLLLMDLLCRKRNRNG